MYLEYTLLLFWHVLSKIIGFIWFFAVVPFRRYANNVVFNYVLQNGIFLKRLLERPIVETDDRYIIQPYHNTNGGYIIKRKVSWIEYQLVFWLIWGFLDADANDDTFSMGRVEELRQSKFWAFFLKGARRNQYGNAFDLGDARVNNFHFFASMFWNTRNTAQNFLYMQWQKKSPPFLHTIFGRKWGWDLNEDGKSYQLVYFKK
jgi:hypothetical protein